MIRGLAIAALALTTALDASGAAAQSRLTGAGAAPSACESRQARCTTDGAGRRWCQMPGQSRVLCGDPRFGPPRQKRDWSGVGPGVGQRACESRQARCVTDGGKRRWCQMRGQTPVLCSDPRFQRPQARTLKSVVPDAIARCMAAGMERARNFGGEEAPFMQIGAIRVRCENGGYRKFLDPNYAPK